ncbi:sodium:proton antiporter [Adlercreutzia sp. R25]|uniref:Sodium:proton antiporter n=1 Tax=Adlercreutzia shanghongiae TaxID=3111773 RepID=A0ABU6IXM6_9ACTN|nr:MULTISPECIES: sodium:proton antiporter [unclassified Adlercreutzia]MEC4272496.1 sodium:proton antiporter [Adlercreutzia sp. R25]MEC4294604.1 sodium:proton antiporter [Adlercreutzia sp. R22]
METFELILFLLIAVIASSILDKFLPRVSLPLVQVALGAVIAVAVQTPLEWGIDPELLLILFIAPLHFNESRHVDSGALWKNRWGIASLSVGLVFAIALACGATLHALAPAVPLAAAIALGGAFGSTDAVAVTALTHDRRFGLRHEALLKGEALFNDVTGTVIFQCCVTLLATGAFSLLHAGEEFALDLFGGMLGGLAMGVAAWALLELIRRLGLDSPTLHVMLELLLPFVIYLAAKSLHIGAVIAVVSAGLAMSLLPQRHTAATARTKLQAKSVWETIEFVLNGIIFVILGMQLPRLLEPATEGSLGDPLSILGIIVALTCVLEAVRFLWLLAMDARAAAQSGAGARACLSPESLRGTLAMAFAGAKGGITLSLMLTLTAGAALSGSDRLALISIASGMIVLTLLLADFAVPALVPSKRSAARSRDRIDAEIGITLGVIASIEADAPLTGAVKGAPVAGKESRSSCKDVPAAAAPHGTAATGKGGGEADGAQAIDEPATVIVMRRYADILEELTPAASPEAAARAKAEVKRVEGLYARIDDIAREAATWDGEPDSALRAPVDHFQALRAVYDAVEDVQSQALARELQLIKAAREAGVIDTAHAKALRNDVYIQQLVLD